MPVRGKTILVVDDSASVLVMSRVALESQGHTVACVTKGEDAIDWLRSHPVSLALLDYRLPDMTGKDVICRLIDDGLSIPFIAMTAHGDEKIAVEMMKLGALDYLVKDCVFSEMLPSVVQQALGHMETARRVAIAEHTARESEGRFRSIFENAAAGMAMVSPTGRFLQVNPQMCRYLGYESEELLMLDIQTITHPDDSDFILELYRDLLEGRRVAFDCDKRCVRRDGSIVWGHASVTGVRDEAGDIRYCVALVQDITGRKRYEELVANIERGVAIKTGDHFFRSLTNSLAAALRADVVFVGELLSQSPDSIRTIAVVADGREANRFDYRLEGAPCANVLGRQICVYPAGVAALFPQDKALATRKIEGYAGAPLVSSSGSPLGLLVALFRQRIPDPGLVESVLQVFSMRAAAELQRRHSAQELQNREGQYKALSQEFQTLLDGIPDVLLLLSRERKVIWANRAAQERMTLVIQRPEEMFCYHFCMGTVGEGACGRCPVVASFVTGEKADEVIKLPDGSLWGVKSFPLKDRDSNTNRVIMLASDVSEKIKLREAAARTDRLAAIGELAAGVAHEINNPTGLILMNMPVVKDAFDDILPILEEHHRRQGDFIFGGLKYSRMKVQIPLLLDEIVDGAQRIKAIVDELKDFARGGQDADFRLFNLNDVLEKAIRLVGKQVRASTDRFSCDLADSLPLIRGAPQRIEQVLINLLINACQALPDKGRGLSLSTCYEPTQRLNKVIVRDEGIGIPEQAMPYLTDPFFTTRREQGGTGLGLSVSARIVKEHGGTLQFESTPGSGTTVVLSLPVFCEDDR